MAWWLKYIDQSLHRRCRGVFCAAACFTVVVGVLDLIGMHHEVSGLIMGLLGVLIYPGGAPLAAAAAAHAIFRVLVGVMVTWVDPSRWAFDEPIYLHSKCVACWFIWIMYCVCCVINVCCWAIGIAAHLKTRRMRKEAAANPREQEVVNQHRQYLAGHWIDVELREGTSGSPYQDHQAIVDPTESPAPVSLFIPHTKSSMAQVLYVQPVGQMATPFPMGQHVTRPTATRLAAVDGLSGLTSQVVPEPCGPCYPQGQGTAATRPVPAAVGPFLKTEPIGCPAMPISRIGYEGTGNRNVCGSSVSEAATSQPRASATVTFLGTGDLALGRQITAQMPGMACSSAAQLARIHDPVTSTEHPVLIMGNIPADFAQHNGRLIPIGTVIVEPGQAV